MNKYYTLETDRHTSLDTSYVTPSGGYLNIRPSESDNTTIFRISTEDNTYIPIAAKEYENAIFVPKGYRIYRLSGTAKAYFHYSI